MTETSKRRIPSHLDGLVVAEVPRETVPAPTHDQPARTVLRSVEGIDRPHDAKLLERLAAATPSRVAAGRTGTRYRTETYLALRADHAIAKDAVHAELPAELAETLGCIEVASACKDREHYLLQPNHGRRLSEGSRWVLEQRGSKGVDVQLIVADGLAAPALILQGAELLPLIVEALQRAGLTVGTPILARLARVGLQDDIGVLLGAKATAICLGERPGLGTGDSLSIYLAVAPRLDQDNAEKNCISNIRPQGMSPRNAAALAAELLSRGIAAGRGGLSLAQT